jgi:sulfatase maturation enzyme AslB (radical SAM superfamily)
MWSQYTRNPVLAEYVRSRTCEAARTIPVDVLVRAAVEAVALIERELPIAVVKVSGGEITLFPEIIAALLKTPSKAAVHKILTNGVLLKANHVDQWREYGKRIIVQVALDGVDAVSNSLRFTDRGLLEQMLREITAISGLGVPIEINTVLTQASIDGFSRLVEWADSHCTVVTLYPRPVRNMPDDRFFPSPEQVRAFEDRLQRDYDRHRHCFPSRDYCELLVHLLNRHALHRECHVPRNVVAMSLSGEINSCTIGGTPRAGNIFENPEMIERFRTGRDTILANCWKVCQLCLCEYSPYSTWRP